MREAQKLMLGGTMMVAAQAVLEERDKLDWLMSVYERNGIPVPPVLPPYIQAQQDAVERTRRIGEQMVERDRELFGLPDFGRAS